MTATLLPGHARTPRPVQPKNKGAGEKITVAANHNSENILYFTLKEFHLVSLVLEIITFLNLGRLHNSAQL
jgi:hypothetical protein